MMERRVFFSFIVYQAYAFIFRVFVCLFLVYSTLTLQNNAIRTFPVENPGCTPVNVDGEGDAKEMEVDGSPRPTLPSKPSLLKKKVAAELN
jgi:hypothetical protein